MCHPIADEYDYELFFSCKINKMQDSPGEFIFIDLQSAMAFAEKTVATGEAAIDCLKKEDPVTERATEKA